MVMVAVMYLFSCNIGEKPVVAQDDTLVPVIYNLEYSKKTVQGFVRLAYVTGHSDGAQRVNQMMGKDYSYDDYRRDRSRDSLRYEMDVVSKIFK